MVVVLYSVSLLASGTFAVVELMIGNSIDKIVASDPNLEFCMEDYNSE